MQPDFDSPWKETIEQFFPALTALVFPAAHLAIDWRRPPVFLDTELQQIIRGSQTGRRYVDKLVRVWLKDGEQRLLLIHIEVQRGRQKKFDERMTVYFCRLFDKFREPVIGLALLVDGDPGWRPGHYSYDYWGCGVEYRYRMVKLLDFASRWDELADSDNPMATVVMAQLKELATRDDAAARRVSKFDLVRRLYGRGFGREDIERLYWFIDWVMQLPDDLEADFQEELRRFEEETGMRYVTAIERAGIEKGIEEGIEKGIEKGIRKGALRQLLHLLQLRFGSVPEEIGWRLSELDARQLEALTSAALSAGSPASFAEHLNGGVGASPEDER